jgi:RimJ/RimL family protein N-acetyltransferase
MPPETIIDTPRLRLRPVTEADIDDLLPEIDDFDVSSMLARVPFPYGREDALAYLELLRRKAGIEMALGIARDGRVIGGIGVAGIGRVNELGYWLGRRHWGAGLVTEAATAFLDHCFGPLGLDIVRSGVFIDNPRSLRVQEKLGFLRVGSHPVHCLARGVEVAHIDTMLARERFLERRR